MPIQKLTRRFRTLSQPLLDVVLPHTCAACGVALPGEGPRACDDCHAELTALLNTPYCRRCGRTVPTPSLLDQRCARCRKEHHWNIAGVARVGLYTQPVRELLLKLKFGGATRSALYLAELLADALRQTAWHGELEALVPVPMHWLRRVQRPCDHARELTDALAHRLALPVLPVVRRPKYTPSQLTLGKRTRRFENVKDCFAPVRLWPNRVRGKTVCIIDNLMSTGATVAEVSKVLRRLGARRIYAAVIARPADPGDPRSLVLPATEQAVSRPRLNPAHALPESPPSVPVAPQTSDTAAAETPLHTTP